MEQRNLEKAVDIYARLMMGEEIRRDGGANRTLYEDYTNNPEYDNRTSEFTAL